MSPFTVREYVPDDLGSMIEIWNEVVEEGNAFPQEESLDAESGRSFFAEQSFCGVAEDVSGNASYAVSSSCRGRHIGEALVRNCIARAREAGFRLLQFNAVVAKNIHARHLYERIGFHLLGTVPGGFRMKNGRYEDICLYYIEV